MLKQILSINDVKKLKLGDQLSDHPESLFGKTYVICNIAHGLVYAILDEGRLELKIFKTDEVPNMLWRVYSPPDKEENMQ